MAIWNPTYYTGIGLLSFQIGRQSEFNYILAFLQLLNCGNGLFDFKESTDYASELYRGSFSDKRWRFTQFVRGYLLDEIHAR